MRLGLSRPGQRPPKREPVVPDPFRAPIFAARARLALLSRSALRHRRSGLGLFAAAAILAHLVAVAAIVLLPRMAGLLHRGPPPSNGQATIELVMQNTPTVGGSKPSNPAKPHPPTKIAKTEKPTPSTPPPLTSHDAPDQISASSADAAATPAPQAVEPTPTMTAASAAPRVNLDPSGEPGYGLATGEDIIPAKPDSANLNAPPVYPVAAEERGEQGAVYLVITVAPDGHASAVDVAASSGYKLLDQEAVRTVSRWHFRPEIRDGQPVQSYFNQRIEFAIRYHP